MATSLHQHVILPFNNWMSRPTHLGGLPVRHPTCADCGPIRSLDLDRPLRGPEAYNTADRVCDLLDASGAAVGVARRLIRRKLVNLNLGDPFAHSRAGQIALLVVTISQLVDVPPEIVFYNLQRSTAIP